MYLRCESKRSGTQNAPLSIQEGGASCLEVVTGADYMLFRPATMSPMLLGLVV